MSDHTRYDLPDVRPSSAAPMTTCPDCGGRGWRRQMGAVACACLAGRMLMLEARVMVLEARQEHDNG
jgi:hypothetical protein